MKRKKFLAMVIACIAVVSSFTVTASAHEIGTNGGYRWYNVTSPPNYYSPKQVQINISSNPTSLSNYSLTSFYNDAVAHWNNNSDGRVNYSGSGRGTIEVPSYWLGSSSWSGYTYIYNSNNTGGGYCETTPNPYSSPGGFTNGTIQRAVVWINPNNITLTTNAYKHYLIRHEMGHVLGLGHPPSTTSSIMVQTTSLNPSYTIQSHDRSDLAAFYP